MSADFEHFFIIDLSTGALSSTFKEQAIKANTVVQTVGEYPSSNLLYTISTYSTGYTMRLFNIRYDKFINFSSSSTKTFYASAVTYGMQYFSSQDNSFYSTLNKVSHTDTLIETILTGADDDITDQPFTIATLGQSLSDDSAARSVTMLALTTSTPAPLIQLQQTQSELNYNNGTLVKIYTPHAYTNIVDMNMP
jgi:hypothetical protein